jgi:hypothetical protein
MLQRAVDRLAAAAALARHWPPVGQRHEAALSLSGILIRGGWSEDEVADFVASVAAAGGDDEAEERRRDVGTTMARLRSGAPATGAPTLAHYIPEAVVRVAATWLGIKWVAIPDASRQRAASVVRLSTVAPRKVCWAWPKRVPRGKVTVTDGDPGLGKSTMLLNLCARVTRDGAMPDGSEGAIGAVVVLSAEDDVEDTFQPRLVAAGANLDRVHALTEMHGPSGPRLPELPRDLDAIEGAVRDAAAVLVIIDPLVAYLGASVDSHRDQDVRRVLAALKALAERTGAAVVGVRHLNKAVATSNPLYRGGGSIGIIGAARSGLLVAKDPDDPERRVLAVTKSNLSTCPAALAFRLVQRAEGVAAVEWLGETSHRADDLLATAAETRPTALAAALEFLQGALADGPLAVEALKVQTTAAGLAWRTVERAKAQLGVETRRRGFGVGGEWEWFSPQRPPYTANRVPK